MSYKVFAIKFGARQFNGRFDSLEQAKQVATLIKDTQNVRVEIVDVGDDDDIPVIRRSEK